MPLPSCSSSAAWDASHDFQDGLLVNYSDIERIIAIIGDPKRNFERYSVTSKPISLKTNRNFIDNEIALLNIASACSQGNTANQLKNCAVRAQEYLHKLDGLEAQTMHSLNFEGKCQDIIGANNFPYDYEDRVWNTYKISTDLLNDMLQAGFTKKRAEDLIRSRASCAQFYLSVT